MNEELTYVYTKENGEKIIWKAKNADELMGLVYQSATKKGGKMIDPFEAIAITDRIEVMYKNADPKLFSWTEDLDGSSSKDDLGSN